MSYLICYLLLVTIGGCASNPSTSDKPAVSVPIGEGAPSMTVPEMPAAESKIDAPENPTGVITLKQALSLALLGNPELASFSFETRASEAKVLQAGLRPNPEIGVDVEQFGGSGDFKGLKTAQTTVLLSQLIEIGGKRAKRTRVAALEKDLAGWDYETKRLDVLTNVSKSFVEVLSGQELVAQNEELVRLSGQVLNSVSERVKAGKVSPLEETKAGVALSNARIALEQARSNLLAARKRLSATWGGTTPSFTKADGDLSVLLPIPSAEELNQLVSQNPDVARWVKEMEQRRAVLESEKAKRIPDITLRGGMQRFNETDDSALVIGMSIPLPIFDRNQGGIRAAQYKLAKAREEARAAEIKAGAGLGEAYQTLSFAYTEAKSINDEVLPAAQRAFVAAGEGYREGKFDFLELLDSQRTLFEAKGKYIQSLSAYHKAKADVERLVGQPLGSVIQTPEMNKGANNQ
ncbi:MAG: TolC family protein [Syntrophobacter sp.]